MYSIGKAFDMRWAEEQSRVLGGVNSDGPSNLVVTQHSELASTRTESPGSPPRNGVVPDAAAQVLVGTQAAGGSQSRSQSPDKPANRRRLSSSDRHSPEATFVSQLQRPMSHRMVQGHHGSGHDFIPSTLLVSSVRLTSSETPWQSPSSSSGRKRDLEPSFTGSPRPKRRLMAEMDHKATSLRNPAPCGPSSTEADGRERRRGGPLLRRGGPPIQSSLAVGMIHDPLPSTTSYLDSERENTGDIRGDASIETIDCQPWPSYEADISSAIQPRESHEVRKRDGYSFWCIASQPAVGNAVPWPSKGEEGGFGSGAVSSQSLESSIRTTRMSPGGTGASEVVPQDPEPQPESHTETSAVVKHASQGALHALESTKSRGGRWQNKDTDRIGGQLDKTPIILCGRRRYSDWTGYWGK
ncbi:hypothetical protein L209DRAFT_676 [Thermothelomyces heterothallicus CBS 203.75]